MQMMNACTLCLRCSDERTRESRDRREIIHIMHIKRYCRTLLDAATLRQTNWRILFGRQGRSRNVLKGGSKKWPGGRSPSAGSRDTAPVESGTKR